LLAEDGHTWFYTPEKSYADFRSLARLTPVSLAYSLKTESHGDEVSAQVHIANPTDHLAFLVHLRLSRGQGGEEILPILWDDNFFSLLPGESRDISATYWQRDAGKDEPGLEVSGWNVKTANPQ